MTNLLNKLFFVALFYFYDVSLVYNLSIFIFIVDYSQ